MKVLSPKATFVVTFVALLVATELWTATLINVMTGSFHSLRGDEQSILLHEQERETSWKFNVPSNSKEIRRWGCNRTETPFIFVHIGKAGGGSVGGRIEASSRNYTKAKPGQFDGSYFPLLNGEKARFVASSYATHLPSMERTYVGTCPCHASTPLGQAIGCPETLARITRFQEHRHGECDPFSESCHLVYSGHNFFGSEMHWLPLPFLQKWWTSLSNSNNRHDDDAITPLWDKLNPNNTWCAFKNTSRPVKHQLYKRDYEECSIPLQRQVDTIAVQTLVNQLSDYDSQVILSWSPLYASLPVLRVTVMRDPFSWLVSKYFWHRRDHDIKKNSTCDNIKQAVLNYNYGAIPRQHELDMNNSGPGWISRMSLGYIMYLCGEDCIVRYASGTATLRDLEVQAEGNLRQAFVVVGILEEVDTFYEMLTARVQYIDTSLNPNVKGAKHRTGRNPENNHCRERFQDPNFRIKLLKLSPELRTINRLYQVAKEVNAFQLEELRGCSASNEFFPAG